MTYGSPASPWMICPSTLRICAAGREPEAELIAEFRRRYELIGGSPLLPITREQAAALQEELNAQHPDRSDVSVFRPACASRRP